MREVGGVFNSRDFLHLRIYNIKKKTIKIQSRGQMNRYLILLILLLANIQNQAATHISGDLSTVTFNPNGNPYIVESNLNIPKDKIVTIEKGCVLLFKPFTGLIVSGRLEILGEPDASVIFSSINNKEYNPDAEKSPEPFDWNGIDIPDSSSGAIVNNLRLSYSVFGIKANSECISITRSSLTKNGQYNFRMHDKPVQELDTLSFSWNPTPEVTSFGETQIQKRLNGIIDRMVLRLPLAKHPTVAVLPFDPMESKKGKAGRSIAEYIVSTLSKNQNITLIERMQLQKTVSEINRSQAGLRDEQYALAAGHALSAEYIVVGTLSEDDPSVVNVRMIETQTSRIVVASNASLDDSRLQEFSKELLGENMKINASVFRSALIPGWGQFFSNKNLSGGISLGLYLGAGAFTAYSGITTSTASKDYNAFKEKLTSKSGTIELRSEFVNEGGNSSDQTAFNNYCNARQNNLENKYDKKLNQLYIAIGVTGAVWGINLIDAAIAGYQNKKRIQLYFGATPKGGVAVNANLKL